MRKYSNFPLKISNCKQTAVYCLQFETSILQSRVICKDVIIHSIKKHHFHIICFTYCHLLFLFTFIIAPKSPFPLNG